LEFATDLPSFWGSSASRMRLWPHHWQLSSAHINPRFACDFPNSVPVCFHFKTIAVQVPHKPADSTAIYCYCTFLWNSFMFIETFPAFPSCNLTDMFLSWT
jgi:hypothetical protein